MGSGCCSNDKDGSRALANMSEPEAAPAESLVDDCECPDDDTCCKDDDCVDDSDASFTLRQCCTSNEEACDEKCILAVAALECEKSCDDDSAHNEAIGHQHAHDKDGNHPASACTDHMNKAFEKYAAYLETARCICRSILDRGFTSTCCDSHKKKSPAVRPGVNVALDAEGHGQSTAHTLRKRRHHHHPKSGEVKYRRAHGHHHEDAIEDDCIKVAATHHHDHDDHSSHESDGSHAHCSGNDCSAPAGPAPPAAKDLDIEKAAGLEVVSILVDGMTCSGCANKVERALQSIQGVSRPRVNFVMGNAEFAVDPRVADAAQIIRNVEKATGFGCVRRASGDQTIDVLASGTSAKALAGLDIPGVTQITIANKKVVQVTYDPLEIGARTLLRKIRSLTDGEGLAPPAADPALSSGKMRLYDAMAKTVAAGVLTIPVVVLAWGDTLVPEKTKAIVSLVLATLVQLIAVPVFYRPAIAILIRERTLEMDMLVTISITAAYVYSLVAFGFRMAGKPLKTAEFFETSTLLITLVLLGRLISAVARIRAVAAVSLRSLQAATATIIEDGDEHEIDARLLQFGDKFVVHPHSRVPTDGRITHGTSEVDESMLTGESLPVPKKAGDEVIAGTINGPSPLRAQVTRLPGKNTVTDIAQLVEEAANSKPKIQDLADKVAGWFVPAVAAVAALVTVVWIVVGLRARRQPASEAVPDAITYAIAVLAVSCPCALGLAVPMVLVVAGGIAARGGVVVKSAECTATARRITDVVFDKTGTLTDGNLEVTAEEFFTPSHCEAASLAKALVAGNNHPVSLAVAKHLEKTAAGPATPLSSIRSIPGAGVEAADPSGAVVRAGTPQWTNNDAHPSVAARLASGMTLLLITRDSVPLALFALRTSVRPEASSVVSALQARNIAVHLVSGDQVAAAEATASALGIPLPNVAARRSPAQKRDYVASLMAAGKSVLFCGDGTNDAVAVAQAHIGVQLAGGQGHGRALSPSDVTRAAADVVLLSGLAGIPFLLDVSRAAFHRIVFNFAWSAVYNVLAILLAAGAFVNFRIPPAYAGLGEIVSVLPVIFAAVSMLALKFRA
ncbi:hypothetical protein jhhlp_001801 [Lomentospora prolificans]|uniref:HMA domain-containing protein n=1 Tax=Lomentospora prolificans TaxID=41688 RepID=A0A2N3NGS7_9PEZI|nr:hypothetical protein jhhlp_001801 [Lomentospora prolificans]